MNVYRIHIRPTGGLDDSSLSFKYCLEKKVLGLGWQTHSQNNKVTWNEYEMEAAKIYGSGALSRVKYLKNNIREDDLIWTRDTKGNYYLAKVKSGWEYYSNKKAQDADIVNIVRCDDIHPVPSVDYVPGKVVACFRPSRTVQAIRDETTSDYSKYLWNKLSNTEFYPLSKDKFKNVFSFLDSEETEDVIFIYLQLQGWIVIPNSRKADTMSYEFYLVHRETKEKSIVQAKTGHTPLTPKNWEDRAEKVFLFQANGKYNGSSRGNVVCISPKDREEFMYANKDLMPANIVHWLNMAENEKKI